MVAILSIKDLTRTFGTTVAVDHLSLDVQEGEIFGLIGPDGAGKTTTMRMMLGILKADSGGGTVGPYSLSRESESISLLTGYVSQRFSLYGELTVEENLELFADIYRVSELDRLPRLKRLMQFSRLNPFRDRMAKNLSGGMRQKLALSCALIHTPKLLFLDEPTTGVDPSSRRDLWKLLFDLWQDGVTIIVSTPYMDEAERCTHVGFLNHGKLIATGRPAELRNRFRGSVLEVFAEQRWTAKEALGKTPYITDVNLFGDGLHVTVEGEAIAADFHVRLALERAGIAVQSVRSVDPTIEDVFLQLAGNTHATMVR